MSRNRTYFPSWQSYNTKESSSLLEIIVSPFELKSKQLILSEFSLKTLATLKLRSTLSVSFMTACLCEGSAPSFHSVRVSQNVPYCCLFVYMNCNGDKSGPFDEYGSKTATKARQCYFWARRRREKHRLLYVGDARWVSSSSRFNCSLNPWCCITASSWS